MPEILFEGKKAHDMEEGQGDGLRRLEPVTT
jgi:hypothetical protein